MLHRESVLKWLGSSRAFQAAIHPLSSRPQNSGTHQRAAVRSGPCVPLRSNNLFSPWATGAAAWKAGAAGVPTFLRFAL